MLEKTLQTDSPVQISKMEIHAPGNLKVLVADDSLIYRRLVQQALEKEHHLLLMAKDGNEALQLFEEHRPDIVITDWSMPDISGPDVCRRIRAESEQHYAYLILVTSNTHKDQVIEGLSAGADDYVIKPFHPGELLARVGVGRRIVRLQRQIEAKNRQLEELALSDPLTGLPNRRAVEFWASRQISAAARYGFAVWVAIADLDHFKRINDTHGHEAGDKVLQGFSGMLKARTRKSNMCGRLGGEEFVLFVTHVDEEQMRTAVERIRKRLEEHQFSFSGRTIRITASFGVAGFRGGEAPDLSHLLKRADSALYTAKASGRNRIQFEVAE